MADAAFSAEQIQAVMAIEDEPVQCVLLRADGSTEEVTVDMTPRKGEVRDLMGGQVTFIGQWTDVGEPDLNVMLVKLADPPAGAKPNQHALPPPFHKVKTEGDILLFRNNEDATPVDLTMAVYEAFRASDHSAALAEAEEAEAEAQAAGSEKNVADGEDDEEEEEEDEGEDEGDEEEMTEEQEMLIQKIVENFTEQKGRAPTEEELVDIMTRLNEATAAAALDEDDNSDSDGEFEGEEDEEEDEDEDDEDEEGEDAEEAPGIMSKLAGMASGVMAAFSSATPSDKVRKAADMLSPPVTGVDDGPPAKKSRSCTPTEGTLFLK